MLEPNRVVQIRKLCLESQEGVMSATSQTGAVWHISGMSHNLPQTIATHENIHDLTKRLSELLAQQRALLESWGQLSDEEAWECSSLQLRKIESLLHAMSGTRN